MAQINVYGTPSNSRICVQYFRDRGDVTIGVQHEDATQVIDAENMSKFPDDGGLWSAIDRAGCNNLIRAIREARDKAFGRDE